MATKFSLAKPDKNAPQHVWAVQFTQDTWEEVEAWAGSHEYAGGDTLLKGLWQANFVACMGGFGLLWNFGQNEYRRVELGSWLVRSTESWAERQQTPGVWKDGKLERSGYVAQ